MYTDIVLPMLLDIMGNRDGSQAGSGDDSSFEDSRGLAGSGDHRSKV